MHYMLIYIYIYAYIHMLHAYHRLHQFSISLTLHFITWHDITLHISLHDMSWHVSTCPFHYMTYIQTDRLTDRQFRCACMHASMHPSMHPSIHPSIFHPFIFQFFHPSAHPYNSAYMLHAGIFVQKLLWRPCSSKTFLFVVWTRFFCICCRFCVQSGVTNHKLVDYPSYIRAWVSLRISGWLTPL